ncbi:hypothetical protein XA68_17682 [Ophiocordyceps unilateralis]|uniref:FHA domain-containing protein n=1 Tax=Ophiocordyceps unilateralis TaxID=268505 RepID=A0A2A9P2P9_OPHUN|nr:hypothetical protein XA68_17682 [Ophiocordyceps unilateralis]
MADSRFSRRRGDDYDDDHDDDHDDDRGRERRRGEKRQGTEDRGRRHDSRRSRSPLYSHRRHRDHHGDRGRDRDERERQGGHRRRDRHERERVRHRSVDSDRGRDRERRGRNHDDDEDGRRDRAGRSRVEDDRIRRHRSRDSDDEAGPRRRKEPLASQQESFALEQGDTSGAQVKPKEKPNLANTGVLAAASNSIVQADGTTTTLKYHEPAEARKPSPRDQWKLFVFKDGDIVDEVPLSHKSCWLVGRDVGVVDVLTKHPSISKQHAVIQFRYMEKRNEFGDKIGKTKPYLLDLESANGTILNDAAVPKSRFLELRPKDMILFGHSTREYVVMLAPRD